MKKILTYLNIFVVLISLLCLYSFSIIHIERGGTRFGSLTEPIKSFYEFPKLAYAVLRSNELWGNPLDFKPRDPNFISKNELTYDVFSLHGSFDNKNSLWEIRLFNLKDDSVHYEWQVGQEHFDYEGNPIEFFNTDLKNIVLLPNRSIVFRFNKTNNVVRLDRDSKLVWRVYDRFHHHSINQDHNNNLWIGSRTQRPFKSADGRTYYYREDQLSLYDFSTGERIFNKSLSEMFQENGMDHIIYGHSNHINSYDQPDPFHLNDIQPLLTDGEFWKKGDIFLSLRHRSMILLYRPATNKILRVVQGPFINQHDVDILSDNKISLFNNNATGIGSKRQMSEYGTPDKLQDSFNSSDVLIYDLMDSTYSNSFKKFFDLEKIYTRTNGLHQFLSNGDLFVESFEEGKIFILNENEIVFKKQLDTSQEDMIYLPHWMQLYEDINF
ncbi:MAG: arylsulfotransferase family protein [Reichenbachiella sp.]|uniref:arylsulfotransferase family protein n=1 Tax=Reichenbachiella sp. TaxID=2184521 RepID=UPI00326459CE